MGQAAYNTETEEQGFVGAVSGMSLADIIQVKAGNRYSGCLIVEHKSNAGVIFFRDGEIVHAEQENLQGEEAFYTIMSWVGGRFQSKPNVSTTCRTIQQSVGFLILEAVRLMDEATNIQKQATQNIAVISSGEGERVSDISTKLSVIQEVEQALVMTKEGLVVDDTSYKAELLAANALFLSLFTGQIGSQFGLGEFKSATVDGKDNHLFLFDSKRHHLSVLAKNSASAYSLDAEIRRVLAQK